MNIYEVIFHGSTGGHPNKDTIYLVRAPDFRTAVSEVANNASPKKHEGEAFPLAHAVYEIGKIFPITPEDHPRVLRGPYIESAYNRGWHAWYRKVKGSNYTREWSEDPLAEP